MCDSRARELRCFGPISPASRHLRLELEVSIIRVILIGVVTSDRHMVEESLCFERNCCCVYAIIGNIEHGANKGDKACLLVKSFT